MRQTIIAVICAAFLGCGENTEVRQKVYHAWMKLNQRDERQLTFKEWDVLYRRELLPNQDMIAAKRAANSAAAMSAMAAGMAAGSVGSRK